MLSNKSFSNSSHGCVVCFQKFLNDSSENLRFAFVTPNQMLYDQMNTKVVFTYQQIWIFRVSLEIVSLWVLMCIHIKFYQKFSQPVFFLEMQIGNLFQNVFVFVLQLCMTFIFLIM